MAADPAEARFNRRWEWLALLLIGVAAICSEGFYHPDEHFQTLEFAGTRLGRGDVRDLPWEYAARMRGWLQPGLYVLEARTWSALGVTDPFTWALGFRLTSGLLAWLALVALIPCVPEWLPDPESRRVAVRALCASWFVPFLAVRTSSETLAASCLALALAAIVPGTHAEARGRRRALALLLGGLALGLAFELRYAMAVAVVSVAAWTFLVARVHWRYAIAMATGFVTAVALGTLADRWGYGEWTFPPYAYFFRNLVEGRAAAQFGSLPWYGFVILAASGPAGVLVLGSTAGAVAAWWRRPWHLLTWATAPFVLVHCAIAHKELRFLFPLAPLAPLLLVLGTAPDSEETAGWRARVWALRKRLPGRLAVVVNAVALAIFSVFPLRPQVGFQRYVRRHDPDVFEAWVLRTSSPWISDGLRMNFYRPQELRLHEVVDLASAEGHGRPHLFLITDWCVPPPASGYACEALYRSLPCTLKSLGGTSTERIEAWDLYRCVAPAAPVTPQAPGDADAGNAARAGPLIVRGLTAVTR